jgi:oligopeptide transport system permease protein
MFTFIIKRIAWSVPVIFAVATLTFAVLRLVPGGPFDREKKLPPEIQANVEARYQLDKPLAQQYVWYIGGLLKGDLGPSYKYLGRNISDIIAETFPVSLALGLLAMLICLCIGIPAGVFAAARRGTWADTVGMTLSSVGISMPGFVLAAMLILVFSHWLKLLPPALWDGWRHAVLPALTLGIAPAAYIARLTRSSVLEVLHRDYLRTARAKGLPEGTVIIKHALKNSLGPVITIVGPLTAMLVTGSFVVEYIFSVPGMGRYFVTAVTNRDYPLIMGVTLVYAVLIVSANLAVDICYGFMDPRMRERLKGGGR